MPCNAMELLLRSKQEGFTAIARLLLRAGANPLQTASNGISLLSLAQIYNHSEVAALLEARIA